MFGFIGKFKQQVAQQMESAKNEVVAGFDAVHQRLVTLEARVDALFHHTATVAAQEAAPVEQKVEAAATVVEDVAKAEADAKQV